MITHPKLKSSKSSTPTTTTNFHSSTATVYTARDFSGYTLRHLKVMYPNSWKEAALHFGIDPTISIESEVCQIKQIAIKQQVWDFYPTPQNAIAKIIEAAQLQPHHHVLEPSAGSGDLAQAIAKFEVTKLDCFEFNSLLRKALKLQRFNVVGDDFLSCSPKPIYDRILANPPFGNNGVAKHTQHAFKFLKPGGRLVTLSHHYQLQPSYSDKQFFSWLQQNNARFLNLGAAFHNSDRPTSIPIQLIAIDKP